MRSIKSVWLGIVTAGALAAGAVAGAAEPVRIGIANFGEHTQLNAAVEGFKMALTEAGFVEGTDVVYTESHTNFDASLVPQVISRLQSEQPALIYTVTTPVSQIAKQALAGSGIPIVFSAVTDPVAANLVPSLEAGDTDMTGASDLQDVAAVMEFTRLLLPDATRLGVPYHPGEANDVAVIEKIKEAAPAAGFEIVEVGVDNVNDIQQRITSLSGRADVIYVPSSNLIQPAVAAVAAAARQIGVPLVNSDDAAVREGIAPASFAVNFIQVGMNAGNIAVQILNGAEPQSIAPIVPAYEDHSPLISRSQLEALGIALPDALADCDCFVD